MARRTAAIATLLLAALAGQHGATAARLRAGGRAGRSLSNGLFDKKDNGYFCTFNGDCKSGHCHSSKCVAAKTAAKAPPGVFEKKNRGQFCTFNGDCKSSICLQSKCVDKKFPNGHDCVLTSDCESGRCLPKMTSQGASAGLFSGGTCVAPPDYPGEMCDASFAQCSSDAFGGAALTCSADCTYASEHRTGSFAQAIMSGNVGNKNIKACCIRDNSWVSDAITVIPRGYKPSCGLNIRKDGEASNWMSTHRFTPAGVEQPASLEEVVAVVRRARSTNTPLKAVGGCASLSRAATTDGTLVHTFLLNRITPYGDAQHSRLFWLETGVTIYDFVAYLRAWKPRRLAMPNLGGWTGQTVVGAVSTSTHGSGTKFAPLGDFVRAIHVVAGDGQQYVFEPKTGARFTAADFPHATLVQDDAQFYSSVVTFGSLGVVYRVLYEALPWYQVQQTRDTEEWANLAKPGAIKAITDEYDHVELWLNMYTKKALVSKRQRHYDLATCDNRGQCASCLITVDPSECAAALATHPQPCSEATEGEAYCVAGPGGECGTAALPANCGGATVFKKLTSHGALKTTISRKERLQLEEFEDIRRDANYNTALMDTAMGVAMDIRNSDKMRTCAGGRDGQCIGGMLDLALDNQKAFSGVQMDYQAIFDTSKANLGTVLTSEVNVPIADAADFGNAIIEYAAQLAHAEKPNFYSAFASMRFTAESRHHMAQSFGGARALMEVISGQRASRYSHDKLNAPRQAELAFDQKTLVDEWATFALARNPAARMHFGLQNKGEWNAKTIADRYPAGAYASLVGMDALYDPQDITRSAFEASVIDASQVRL